MLREDFPNDEEFGTDKFAIRVACSKTRHTFFLLFERRIVNSQWLNKITISNKSKRDGKSWEEIDISKINGDVWNAIRCPSCQWNEWPVVVQCLSCGLIMCGNTKQTEPRYSCLGTNCNNYGKVNDTIKKITAIPQREGK